MFLKLFLGNMQKSEGFYNFPFPLLNASWEKKLSKSQKIQPHLEWQNIAKTDVVIRHEELTIVYPFSNIFYLLFNSTFNKR